MSDITLYGIPNCDTVKKTMDWFKKKKIDIGFHNYKTAGITEDKLTAWSKLVGWETIFNKKSTTWRELPASEQEKIKTQADAITLMMEHTSIIKRPVIETGKNLLVGFNEAEYAKTFK
jgi:arsenate reductase